MHIENLEFLKVLKNLEKRKTNSEFDCVVPISGGKDGIFILWYIKKYSNLNPVAFHIDNWYIAQESKKNIDIVTKELNCELVIQRPEWSLSKKIYRNLLLSMGEICIACEMMINLLPLRYAIEKGIPNIIWGLTPKQLVSKNISDGIKQIDFDFYSNLSEYYKQIILSLSECDNNDLVNKFVFLDENNRNKIWPEFVFPFYYLEYDANEIEEIIKKNTSWTRPKSVGGTSSNCVINNLHIYLKRQIKGDEYYKSMLEKKLNSQEVTKSVIDHALQGYSDFSVFQDILQDLDIGLSQADLLNGIKGYKKNMLLRKESNISQ